MKGKWLKYERETRLAGFLIVATLLVINVASILLLNNTKAQYRTLIKLRLDFIAEVISRQISENVVNHQNQTMKKVQEIADLQGLKEVGLLDSSGLWKFSTSGYRMQFPGKPIELLKNYPPITGGLGKTYKAGNAAYINYIYEGKINQDRLVIIAPVDFLAALEAAERMLSLSLMVIGCLIFVFLYFYLKNIFAPFREMAQSAKHELSVNAPEFDSDVELVMDTYHKMIEDLKEKGRQLGELYDQEKNRADSLEHYSRQVLDSIDKAIVTLDDKGKVMVSNKAAAKMFGENAAKKITDLFPGISNGQGGIKEIEDSGGRKTVYQLEVSRFREINGKDIGYNIVISDITEASKMEELAGYTERADLINSAAESFLHKLNPMIESLRHNIPVASGKTAENLSEIQHCLNDYGRIFSLEKVVPVDGYSPNIICQSAAMQNVLQMVAKVAVSDSTVLITGESGTGKELVAKEIHRLSLRAAGPFITLNCAALPETLLESELFGYVKGAFTGAGRDKPGLFKVAEQGSFFLDEVSELSFSLQAKILRVIQEREVVPVGSTKPSKVDVRLIAATNQNLEKLVNNGKFRQDLFYRLNVFPIFIPPLRERIEDIEPLMEYFIKKYALKQHKPVSGINPAASKIIINNRWPGNIRQLENAIERAVIMARGNRIELSDIEFLKNEPDNPENQAEEINDGLLAVSAKAAALAEVALIKKVLRDANGNKSEASRRLKISYRVMLKKIKDYRLE